MALLHRATLSPTKIELLAEWLPERQWFRGEAGAEVVRVAGYRFDDPAGEVGIETMLVRAGEGPVLQVPLTYREAPLEGGDGALIGTAEHSVLGQRWVYDACADPVYATALANAIFAGAGQAQEYFEVDGRREYRENSMSVISGGSQDGDIAAVNAVRRIAEDEQLTRVETDPVELTVVRRPDDTALPAGAALTGTWSGQSSPLLLAYASPR